MADDIIKEIQREQAEQRYQQFFIKNGKTLIGCGLAIVLATAAGTTYRNYMEERSRESGTQFITAFENSDPQSYNEVIEQGQKGFAPLAGLMKGALLNVDEKHEDALKALEEVANNNSFDRAFREKAKLDMAYILIQSKGDSKQIIALLDELSGKDAVFGFTALELKAAYLIASGNAEQGRGIYSQLAADVRAPQSVQERARNVLATVQ